jgi:hypothetical protein
MTEWVTVRFAHECVPCEDCDDVVCPECKVHYYDCACPGPHMEDEYEYREVNGELQARRWTYE